MAQKQQPKIEIEDLQPKDTLAGYRATWQEGGLIASAYLEPINDQPARGFILEYTYHTVSGREPGNRQIDAGTTLISKVRDLMIGHMVQAGWRQAGREPTGRTIWQHQSRLETSREPAPPDIQDATFTLNDYTATSGYSFQPQYAAKAVQEDVQATVTLLLTSNQPGWYRVERLYERTNSAPGALGRKQKPRALALLAALDERVQSALQAAGWAKQGELWHPPALISSEAHPQDQDRAQVPVTEQAPVTSKLLVVQARPNVAGYIRRITMRSVTFTCSMCGKEVTRLQYPGGRNDLHYCEECGKEAEKERTRARVAHHRARRQAARRLTLEERHD